MVNGYRKGALGPVPGPVQTGRAPFRGTATKSLTRSPQTTGGDPGRPGAAWLGIKITSDGRRRGVLCTPVPFTDSGSTDRRCCGRLGRPLVLQAEDRLFCKPNTRCDRSMSASKKPQYLKGKDGRSEAIRRLVAFGLVAKGSLGKSSLGKDSFGAKRT